ncbi:unnamed protein product [Caenorhabditis auriculariae]|uniref:RCR-type E3 ubiquitin transferase n=1 Tax=Caenorhabditis auriculariae TaxID=2777116 RepID=A0A8S1HBU2_9PELO|nr:unnamed protein product [Caenorhabditis auriculariae]
MYHCVAQTRKNEILKISSNKEVEGRELSRKEEKYVLPTSDILEAKYVVGAPSLFACVAMAKTIVTRFGQKLEKLNNLLISEDDPGTSCQNAEEIHRKSSKTADQLVGASLSCVFEVLQELSRRDTDLCVQALDSLLSLLQTMPIEGLRHENKASVGAMAKVLRQLREEGPPSVVGRASSCLAALAVASGEPELLSSAIQSLVCVERLPVASSESSFDQIQLPSNLHRLLLNIRQKVSHRQKSSPNWSSTCLKEHKTTCSFDLPLLPNDSPVDSPDDDHRLFSAIACDGVYVYVLNYVGLYKLGTGLQETIIGRLYTSNQSLKATKNCMLTFCNSSLYLRRNQSSCVSVIDVDTLSDIGEIILSSGGFQNAIFSDGYTFFNAILAANSTLSVIPLNDSFVPQPENAARKKYRLTDVSFACYGEDRPIPYQLPQYLPSKPTLFDQFCYFCGKRGFSAQAVDLHLGKEVAFLQARSGKVYYAGNGKRFGLHETGNVWMELVLPEPVVQVSVGSENIMFRSGAGHAWIAGSDEKNRVGRLRRLATANRRKTVSVCCSGSMYAYVTENGKVFVGGRHTMRVHASTDMLTGLENVHMVLGEASSRSELVQASVYLAKTHGAAISRSGHLYTWGLNNLNQCGREQPSSAVSATPRQDSKAPKNICGPSEHIWVKDMPSMCAQCGLCSSRGSACGRLPRAQGTICPCGTGESTCLKCGLCRPCGETTEPVALGVPQHVPFSSAVSPSRHAVSPGRVTLTKGAHDAKVSSVSCGNFHTVILAADKRVFTFGSNCHGQLGTGNSASKSTPQLVKLPADAVIVQVAAGANHTVLRSSDGSVFTFGAHAKGQLARPAGKTATWYAMPERVPGYGPGFSAFAAWIGAHGDVTLVHSHAALLNNDEVVSSQIVASKNDIFIFPREIGKDYIVIRRKHNTFEHYSIGADGLYTSWALESRFDLLWSYNAAEMRVQALSIYAHESKEDRADALESLSYLNAPEFAVPLDAPAFTSSLQLGTLLLSATFAAHSITKSKFWSEKSNDGANTDVLPTEGYSVASRFDGAGGGWGYSAHSIEAIQFKVSKEIRLVGIGLYGGRGEYISKLKLYRLLGEDADELYVEQVTETDETLYDCGAHETATLLFTQPIIIQANQWHVVSAKISGPSSDCGAAGKPIVECEGVSFTFRNSVVSNNGTDVNVGQIPELYYKLNNSTDEDRNEDSVKPLDLSISRLFSPSCLEDVTPNVLSDLLAVFDWSVSKMLNDVEEDEQRCWKRERAAFLALLAMRSLGRYVLRVYPAGSSADVDEPSLDFASRVVQLHSVLLSFFATSFLTFEEEHNRPLSGTSANWNKILQNYAQQLVMKEAIKLFVSLSHCFLGSRYLVNCHLVSAMTAGLQSEFLTAAVIGSLAKMDLIAELLLNVSYVERYPMLSMQIIKHFDIDKDNLTTLTSFQNVVRFLYDRCFQLQLTNIHDTPSFAQDIIVKISQELAIPDFGSALGPTVHHTSSRFRRRSGQTSWEMANGSADAIAFRIDAEGIRLHGFGVYLTAEKEKRTFSGEVYMLTPEASEKWSCLFRVNVDIGAENQECGVIRLPEHVLLSPGVTYAVKLWMPKNSRTFCGENGTNQLRLCDGTRLFFSGCSLSQNGTTVQRGQIPFLLYSVTERSVNSQTTQDKLHESYLLLLRLLSNKIGTCANSGALSDCARSLVSRISAHVMVFMELFPQKCLEIMATLEPLIPLVSNLNALNKFDDQLSIYLGVDRNCYIPIERCYGSQDWPSYPIFLPGNSLWFVLETAAPVEGATVEQMYGFQLTVTGYPASNRDSEMRVEQELVWLSANACRIMTQLPVNPKNIEHLSLAEEDTRHLFEKHGSLLKKGLSLNHVPTLNEIIVKGQPPPAQSADLQFLREFLSGHCSSAAGFLARWLPTGSVVDPSRCQISFSHEEMVVGRSTRIKLSCRDQFEQEVECPNIVVEVLMTLSSNFTNTTRNIASESLPSTLLIHQNPFQPIIVNHAKYMNICAMPAFANYSAEEIRLGHMKEELLKDRVTLKHRAKSVFVGSWVPSTAGTYRIECKVDGYEISYTYNVEVIDKEHVVKAEKAWRRGATLTTAQCVVVPFTCHFSGVRMRIGTTLSSTCVGVVPRGAVIEYIEESENEDGKWIRLTDETALLYGHSGTSEQVWCMAYHRPLRRELIPLGDPEKSQDRLQKVRKKPEKLSESEGRYQNVSMDAKETYNVPAHDILQVFSQPNPDHIIQNEKICGPRELVSSGWISNTHGVWIKIAGTEKYVLQKDSESAEDVESPLSFSTNGNEEEERQMKVSTTLPVALPPSVADCARAVFAAFVWHEHLVKDAMAAAAYLKFHQNLHKIWFSCDSLAPTNAPAALQPIVKLWREICNVVEAVVDQHLIMPPVTNKAILTESFKPGGDCELCYGYNSNGKFTTGWSGECGSGGRGASPWYLLCNVCRSLYLRKTPAGHHQERTRRWREFRVSTIGSEARPEIIMKQNALFLLDLNSSLENGSKNSSTATSGWTINLFPTHSSTPSTMPRTKAEPDTLFARSSYMAQSLTKNGHSSDPGPKLGFLGSFPNISVNQTASLCRNNVAQDVPPHEVLQSPSAALRTLFSQKNPSMTVLLKQSVLAFCVEHHDLKRIRAACVQSVRRAVSFAHAFRVWNWLLRLVSSENSVSDIILQYLSTLSSYNRLSEYCYSAKRSANVLPHPWRLCFLAGPIAGQMVGHLHAFLYTVSVILQSSGVDGRLRSLCFNAWTLQLTAQEQDLLILTCNILATVGTVLSDVSMTEPSRIERGGVNLKEMRDVSDLVKIEASSRQAMVVCLTDGSAETFWESGDEDKSRVRTLTVTMDGDTVTGVLLALFVDNVRDENYRVTSVSVREIQSDGTRRELLTQYLEPNFCGWIKTCVANVKQVQVSIKGVSPSSRIRQLAVLGFAPKSSQSQTLPPSISHHLLFSNTQRDAFALFQAISSQAFCGELSEDETLRERVIDLLFSRVQLYPLQNYVSTQVVQAMEKEVDLLCSQAKRNYSYCCGLMGLLVRICDARGSSELFSQRSSVLTSITQLLTFAPLVVQRQCLNSIECVLGSFQPSNVEIPRILRNMLIVVGKVIQLQVRDKAAHEVNTVYLCSSVKNAPQGWRVDRATEYEIGQRTAQLISRICEGAFSGDWAEALKTELANCLVLIVQMSDSLSSTHVENQNLSIVESKYFWLAISALALIKNKSWLELSRKWRSMQQHKEEESQTLCENHDDGHTVAQVFCLACETSLCKECFTVMHLHKKNRSHGVKTLVQSTTQLEVNVHQGCARLRLSNFMVLFHGEFLNGMVEISRENFFPEATTSTVQSALAVGQSCRFCGNAVDSEFQNLEGTCNHEDCLSYAQHACLKTLPCTHMCGGIKGETECLNCLHCNSQGANQDGDDVCVVCFTERLGAAPCVRLRCGHLFHFHCMRSVLLRRWNGPRILFRFINCPLCNQQIDHPGLADLMEPVLAIREEVVRKAKMRLEYDGLLSSPALTDPLSEYFNQPEEYALDRYMYVLCHKCNKAYFGGESHCQNALDTSQYNPEELICGACSDTSGLQICNRHGAEFLEYKCRFCCSIAVYFCFGTTHFCAQCHDDFQRLMALPKSQLPPCPVGPRAMPLEEGPCPLKIAHPPTGEEFAMGCGICRNISTF